jgi:pilus assembly protein CpaB
VNPRQRRGILLIAMATIGLVMVFVLVAGYVADVRSEVDPKITVLQLGADIGARQPFDDRTLRDVEVPERWAPPRALRDRSTLAGLVAGVDLPRGATLQQGMAVAPPELEKGQREIAILVDAETGVAGKVGAGSTVDVVATFEGERSDSKRPESRIIVSNARVIAIGQPSQRKRGSETTQVEPGQVVPVTFALSPVEALTMTYAESFAQEVRLALIRQGDSEPIPRDERAFPAPRR